MKQKADEKYLQSIFKTLQEKMHGQLVVYKHYLARSPFTLYAIHVVLSARSTQNHHAELIKWSMSTLYAVNHA
jgi:hypothetical protein